MQDFENGKQRRLDKLSFVGHSIGMPPPPPQTPAWLSFNFERHLPKTSHVTVGDLIKS